MLCTGAIEGLKFRLSFALELKTVKRLPLIERRNFRPSLLPQIPCDSPYDIFITICDHNLDASIFYFRPRALCRHNAFFSRFGHKSQGRSRKDSTIAPLLWETVFHTEASPAVGSTVRWLVHLDTSRRQAEQTYQPAHRRFYGKEKFPEILFLNSIDDKRQTGTTINQNPQI